MQITVGPPILTINHSSTFMSTDLSGQVQSDGYLGIFSDDTRFLSYYACYIDGHPWTRVTSTATTYYTAQIHLTNPKFRSRQGTIAAGTIALIINRVVESGIHEELHLTNYGQEPVSFNLEISMRSDFADIFEIEFGDYVRRGHIETTWEIDQRRLSTTYTNGESHRRSLIYQIGQCPSSVHYANGRLTFEITLDPGETWSANNSYILVENDRIREVSDYSYDAAVDPEQINTNIERLHQDWCRSTTKLSTSNQLVEQVYQQSIADLGGLRLFDYDAGSDIWVAAAGVPKFLTLFGRDSLITSLQTMMVHSGFALGALHQLAKHQSTEYDDWRDAQPGKILHEVRQGELARLNQIPHTPYYGTADATPLFLITLHETWKWLGDDSLLKTYRTAIYRALDWLDRDGDRDGDGFQEYQKRSSAPYSIDNQGWKDSHDAIVYPDGSQVPTPKALCELQGYAFDARMRMAEVFDRLGEREQANELRQKASQLRDRFEEKFWSEEQGFYALTLDPDKQPVHAIASNVGHCLWSGIIRPDRGTRVAERFMAPDMSNGWGIRTLSAENPAYNPFSYHCGSVWPHDNSLTALGLKRYGCSQAVAEVAKGIFDAAGFFSSYRLPELFAGIERKPGSFPVPYKDANVPQAWAAASVFQLLQAILGLQADAPNGCLTVDPVLPDWLPDITLRNIQVGNAQVSLQFWREGEHTRWDATVNQGNIEVRQQAWQPWETREYAKL
ncbi:MAG: hypothetical protein MUF49_17930 [Oculatellaceae cyanobacterium Prado106]|nr:hypothetical protein [Oculatellaceae cyanobacterium Prado106]